MKGKHKLNVTRPKFSLEMMSGGDVDQLNDENMRTVLYDASTLSYVVYTVLMEANLQKKDIIDANNDGESIAVRLESKSMAKSVAEKCRKEKVRYGHDWYQVHVKVHDKYAVFTAELLPEDDDDDEEE